VVFVLTDNIVNATVSFCSSGEFFFFWGGVTPGQTRSKNIYFGII